MSSYGPPRDSAPPDLAPAVDKRPTVLLVVVPALALLLGVGGLTALLVSDGSGGQSQQNSAPSPGVAAVRTAGEFRSIAAGECMVNDGTDEEPRPRLVACAPGTYEVLERFDGTMDYASNCASVPGYQFHFSYDSNLDTLDFVLCMRQR